MKKTIVFVCLVSALGLISAQAQTSFSIKTGFLINSGQIGFKTGNFNPYFGLGVASLSEKYSSEGDYLDYSTFTVEEEEYKSSFRYSAIIPTLGTRYYIGRGEKLKSYANLSLSLPQIILTEKYDGVSSSADEDELNAVIYSTSIGFGTEYYFAPEFSVGGEFNFMYTSVSVKNTYENGDVDPDSGDELMTTTRNNFGLLNNMAMITLNYYFGKKTLESNLEK